MTTVELALRLLRYLTVDDLSKLSMSGRLDMITAVNAAIQEYHLLAPNNRKESQLSATAQAPANVSITVTNGSREFSGFTATEEQIYSTIKINSDDQLNHQIVSPTEFLSTYEGQSGTFEATVYGDAVNVAFPVEAITSHPVIESYNRKLLPITDNEQIYRISDMNSQKTIGEPRFYLVENKAGSDEIVSFVIRLDTLPEKEYRMRMDVQIAPLTMNVRMLTEPIDLRIKESHIELILLPIVLDQLSTSEFWRDESIKSKIESRAGEAKSRLTNMTVKYNTTQMNRVGTPERW